MISISLVVLIIVVCLLLYRNNRLLKQRELKVDLLREQLNELGNFAKVGLWNWYFADDSFEWTDYLYVLMGIEKGFQKDISKILEESIHQDDKRRVEVLTQRVVESLKPDTFDFRVTASMGEKVHLKCHCRPMLDRNGKLVGLYGIDQNVTYYKLVQSELERAKEREDMQAQLVSSSRLAALGQMAGNIAHEINNPLAIISGSVRRLERVLRKDNYENANAFTYINDINEIVERIARIIDSLGHLSQEGVGEHLSEIRIDMFFYDVKNLCSKKFESSGVDLRFIIPEELHGQKIFCPRIQLGQVLINLLNNSFDAVLESQRKTIDVAFVDNNSNWSISVTDSGVGISDDIVDKIMDPFFTTKKIGKGTGLGLSISKSIMEACGGELFIDRSSSQTRFVVEFPKQSL